MDKKKNCNAILSNDIFNNIVITPSNTGALQFYNIIDYVQIIKRLRVKIRIQRHIGM